MELKSIVLTTLNARYTHSSIGLRYLLANMQELQGITHICEYTINDKIQDVAEKILELDPEVVGIGIYIWNALESKELIEIIKKVSPKTKVVLGGPEVSYTPFRVDYALADYIIQGEGDTSFYALCKQIENSVVLKERIIRPVMEDLKTLKLPYAFYTPSDIQNRYIYVEASRGCPFLCEFCLSSIDEKVRNFEIEPLLEAFEMLWQQGVRNFKFIDRTFNLNMRFANKVLDFFLSKEPPYFAHFEVIPDHFPESIKEKIKLFPKGSLQLEVGIQTLNPEISENISRPLKLEKIRENLRFIEEETQTHMHVDLIVGLPGESLKSFADNLNALYAMTHSEIQIGILKKLSGTAIDRHDVLHGMVYSDTPPYDILKTNDVSFKQIQQMKRFARFWDLVYNSGNFTATSHRLFTPTVFDGFFAFSQWIYAQTDATWKIALDRLAHLIFIYATQELGDDENEVAKALIEDITKVDRRRLPKFLHPYDEGIRKTGTLLGKSSRQEKRADL